jgi:hypothetical protein
MGKMKELAMQLREQEMQEPIPGVDFPIHDPEDQYWEERAREHDEFMMDVSLSGYPSHMVDLYGTPTRNEVIIDELPTTCRVCGDYTAPGNEYCGIECKEVYHKSISNCGTVEGPEDLPF